MGAALAAAPLAAAAGGLVYGWLCVRLSGIYLAMLTLAFAQLTWAVAYQWDGFTGGSNGITGVWPPEWAAQGAGFYLLALALCAAGIYLLRRMLLSPWGYALRAARDAGAAVLLISDDLDEVLSSGDEVVSLFERSGKRPARMGSHAARPSVNRQKRARNRNVQEEAGATPEAPEASPNEPADACAAEETALMEAASAIVVADQAAVTTAEAEEALAPRATGESRSPLLRSASSVPA